MTVLAPPEAMQVEHFHTYHGRQYSDNFNWIKSKDPESNKDIMEYINYFDEYFTDKKSLIESLVKEKKELETGGESIWNLPFYNKPYYYYWRKEEGKKRQLYCRRKDSMEGEEQVLLDMNEFTEAFVGSSTTKVSPDHSMLAYSLDFKGDENYAIYFKNLNTMQVLPDETIPVSSGPIVWSKDSCSVFYVQRDEKQRPCSVYRHTLGKESVQVYFSDDEGFRTYLQQSISKEYLFIVTYSKNTREWLYIPLADPQAEPELVVERSIGHEYFVEHIGNQFLITTNGGGVYRNNRVCICPIEATALENWKELVAYDPNIRLIDVIAFKSHVVLIERTNGQNRYRVFEYDAENGHLSAPEIIDFPEQVYFSRIYSFDQLNYNSLEFDIIYESPISPPKVLCYNLSFKTLAIVKETSYKSFDSSLYTCEMIQVPIAPENQVNFEDCILSTTVPLVVVYRKDLMNKDGSNPAYLKGYGAYGTMTKFFWNSSNISLLDRGYVVAAAFVRGGDKSKEWHDTGRLHHKKNSFVDFVSCAKAMFERKLTSPQKLAIEGKSAGGLLIGAVLNMEPGICKSALLDVPFLDVINTMMDPSIPLTIQERGEWGDPNKPETFDYVMSYSPYENIPKGEKFPNVMINTSVKDTRVPYWEPMKYLARLRERQKSDSVFVGNCNTLSGHFGGLNDNEEARAIAFIISTIQ
ncbi:hypothetical protein HDV01_000891 [Terramyces sp. JEL0728]|nr:hypothetical protein HDV01_000891 [Terramyces sp. JEL0728]